MDKVRQAEMSDDPKAVAAALGATDRKTIKGLMWGMRKNPGGWSVKQTHAMHWLQHSGLKSARAWRLKMALREVYAHAAAGYDQGTEMALHQALAGRLHMDISFCDPHSPWQRGTNENSNGLIREYLPKGTDLAEHSHQRLASIEATLNNRPRKVLGYRTPAEVFAELKLHQVLGVALQA